MLRADQLDVDLAFVLAIDLQDKLVPFVCHHQLVISAGSKLLEGTRAFDLPVLATEQYPRGLGRTHETIRRCLEETRTSILEKPTFSAWAHAPVREAILAIDRPQVIVIGVETHVCVQQTALDLASRDYDVCVCADATGSRGRMDYEQALERMRQSGVLVTTVESVLFELCQRCDTPEFKAVLEVIKATPPSDD